MDGWSPSKPAVEKPKPAKVLAALEADFLKALEAAAEPDVNIVVLSRKRVLNLVKLLDQLSGVRRG